MLNTLLNIGCALDWITPVLSFLQDALWGPVGDFGIPADSGWTRKEIKRLLLNNGVQVWGLLYNFSGDTLLFTVQKRDAELAYYLLQREGIPVLYAPVDPVDFDLENESPDLYINPDEFVPCYPENNNFDY
jgi:hypothetical protein